MAFFGVEIKAKRQHSKSIDNPQVIGDHIRNRRIALNFLQADIAKIFDVSEDSITGWESGRSVPQIQFYPKIIEFLDYNPFPFETETLGERIRKYRFEHGLSHRKFGHMLGIDASTIGAWEKNEHVPISSQKNLTVATEFDWVLE